MNITVSRRRKKPIGESYPCGSFILCNVEPALVLVFGCGGERITYHRDSLTIPAKRQFLLEFDDGTYLSITVQGWGSAQLVESGKLPSHPHVDTGTISPVNEEFTYESFDRLFVDMAPKELKVSVKQFITSKPGSWGLGNGYLQDILFQARIHPQRKLRNLNDDDKHRLYHGIRGVVKQAVACGGRDTELDLYGQPGRYRCIMDRRSVGTPCPSCGTSIEKISFQGGTCYFCPACQR
jgi:formamidopyrimidine-DNA glycosylase